MVAWERITFSVSVLKQTVKMAKRLCVPPYARCFGVLKSGKPFDPNYAV
jgi:hypothetical protein